MEDYIDLIIYGVLILLSLAGGLAKNRGKNRRETEQRESRPRAMEQQQQEFESRYEPEPAPKPSTNPFEEFLRRQLEGYETVTEITEEDISDVTVAEEPSPLVSEEKPDAYNQKEGNAVFTSTTDELLSDNMNDKDFSITDELSKQAESIYLLKEDDTEEENIAEDFDGKRAVIFSEILARPKYQ